MIILIGESASGKSTLEKELVKKGLKKIVSYTSRPMRDGEVNGVDYHFISDDEFIEKLGDNFFAEYTNYNGWHYGVAREDCEDDSVVVVEPFGFRQLKRIPNLKIISFYVKVPERERLIRMAKRGDNLMELFRRIISDQGLFQGIEDEVNYVLDSNDIEVDVDFILGVIQEEKEWDLL